MEQAASSRDLRLVQPPAAELLHPEQVGNPDFNRSPVMISYCHISMQWLFIVA